jgi:hypothetical protein
MGLTTEQIDALYANRRVKGFYEDCLIELDQSDENGADAMQTWPSLANKAPATVYQGFTSALAKFSTNGSKSIADNTDVIKRENAVFLIRKDRLEVVEAQ